MLPDDFPKRTPAIGRPAQDELLRPRDFSFFKDKRYQFQPLRLFGRESRRTGIGPGWLMTTVVAVIFGVFAIGLIVLLIYKSKLTMHRDDQLFLDDASSHMHAEQTELLTKVSRLILPVRVFSMGSGNRYNFDPYSVPLLRIDYWSVLTKVGLHAFHQCPERSRETARQGDAYCQSGRF